MTAGIIERTRGGRRRRRTRTRPMSEINVTPFVDVMLVLLIIFMVAAPLLTTGVDVRLPETAADPLPSEDQEPLTVTLTAEGGIVLMSTPVAGAELIAKLRAVQAERASARIYLRADGSLPYERVMRVMGALNAAGFADIALVTDPAPADETGIE
ncbi:MAG: ExbD/TolR family protein [Rhodobacteraceae bacterium]|jgi:biopolymer transport protein TolR|nr:ExbD/TolR family protein [Paracoccaceae bacterium]